MEGLEPEAQAAVDSAVSAARAAFTAPVSLADRTERLDRLEAMVRERADDFLEALALDLGKHPTEGWTTELGTVLAEIGHLRKLLPEWLRPRKVPAAGSLAPSRSWVENQPLGTVLVIAPWNYPVQLVLSPLAGALAAGNTAVVKPSEVTPHVAKVLVSALRDYLGDVVGVVTGGVPETTRVLQHRFDHVFYTGNATVGRVVMRAAAQYLTPVTLELGGKSPVWIDDTVDLGTAADRIAWAKFLNAGQTCVAPDYVMGPPEVLTRLEPLLVAAIRKLYGRNPAESESYGRIVTERHLSKLTDLLADVAAEDVVTGGARELSQRYLAPTVIRSAVDGPFMRDEIFGPVLPLVPVEDHHAAVGTINSGEKPLALYVFSEDDDVRTAFRGETSSGGLVLGAALVHLAHPQLPFGGVGESGIGNYHGEYSLETFSHPRAVLDKPLAPDTLKVIYPPYGPLKSRLAKIALGAPAPSTVVRKLLNR
ncbi:aldehyde dehydrogenase family protein [Kocuria sp. JC486]|uniref:aldehyde dehydrogenase family protein n=1 Tax=Kocuria sp. JC486 TaxID=1970736 RepID=UPI0032B01022